MAIQIKTLEELKVMRRAGLLVADVLEGVRQAIKPGVRTDALDAIASAIIKRGGGKSNFFGYHGFPATICVSINDEVVHGIPSDRVLEEGDLISVDAGAIIEGWHGDAAFSCAVGSVGAEDQKMMDVCEESMWAGIAAAKVGGRLTDIGAAVQSYIEAQGGYGILRDYGGHGIGTEMHQEPHVLNFGKPGQGPELVPGMSLAIEPMITRGSHKTKVLEDEWTVVTIDGSRGSHFEHSFALLPDGKPFVLTSADGGRARLSNFGVTISDLLV